MAASARRLNFVGESVIRTTHGLRNFFQEGTDVCITFEVGGSLSTVIDTAD